MMSSRPHPQQQHAVPLLLLLAQTSPLWPCHAAQHTAQAQAQTLELAQQQQQHPVVSVCVPASGA